MKTKLNNKHFAILGVTKFSTNDEIKKAYKELMKIWHPDKFENNSKIQNEAQEKSKKINDAFSHFKDFTPAVKKVSSKTTSPNYKINKKLLEIKRMRVNSMKVSSIGYDAGELVLQVELKNGSIHQYYNVTSDIYSLLMMVGFNERYFNKSIANRFHREVLK